MNICMKGGGIQDTDGLCIADEDLRAALKMVRPSAMREVAVDVPKVYCEITFQMIAVYCITAEISPRYIACENQESFSDRHIPIGALGRYRRARIYQAETSGSRIVATPPPRGV